MPNFARRPSPALVISVIALIRGRRRRLRDRRASKIQTSEIAKQAVTNKKIAKKTIKANRIANDTLGGKQIDENKLGTVPREYREQRGFRRRRGYGSLDVQGHGNDDQRALRGHHRPQSRRPGGELSVHCQGCAREGGRDADLVHDGRRR